MKKLPVFNIIYSEDRELKLMAEMKKFVNL